MRRYTLAEFQPGLMVEQPEGEWVRWEDVAALAVISSRVATRHDVLLAAMRAIASVPHTLPSASAAVCIARDTLAQEMPEAA